MNSRQFRGNSSQRVSASNMLRCMHLINFNQFLTIYLPLTLDQESPGSIPGGAIHKVQESGKGRLVRDALLRTRSVNTRPSVTHRNIRHEAFERSPHVRGPAATDGRSGSD